MGNENGEKCATAYIKTTRFVFSRRERELSDLSWKCCRYIPILTMEGFRRGVLTHTLFHIGTEASRPETMSARFAAGTLTTRDNKPSALYATSLELIRVEASSSCQRNFVISEHTDDGPPTPDKN